MPDSAENTEIDGVQLAKTITLRPDGSLSIRDAAAILGLSRPALDKWIDKGCPHSPGGAGRGNIATVNMLAIVRWHEAQAIRPFIADRDGDGPYFDFDAGKAAKMHFAAVMEEAVARRHLGSLVPIDRIADVVEGILYRIRSTISSIPSRISAKVAAESDTDVVRRILIKEINNTLKTCSDTDTVIRKAGGAPGTSVSDRIEIGHVAGAAIEPEDDREDEDDDV